MSKIIDYKTIVERLMQIVNREEKIDEAFATYMEVVAPASHTPILDDSITTSFIQ
jgi:hypothetical protein